MRIPPERRDVTAKGFLLSRAMPVPHPPPQVLPLDIHWIVLIWHIISIKIPPES
jgi:hypothetical protein